MTLPVLESSTSSLNLSDLNNAISKNTFFESVLMIYCRTLSYEYINKNIYRNSINPENLLSVLSTLSPSDSSYRYLNNEAISDFPIFVWELKTADYVVGVATKVFTFDKFNEWMINLLLNSSNITYPQLKLYENSKVYTKLIVDEFVRSLKNSTANDQWNFGGKEYFENRVDFYTSRGLKIEAVLPAFPCKSSNTNKVSGWKPDRGEILALNTLCQFAKAVKAIYPPGILIWIVSDGHVFSDCIGVDDDVVNSYGEELKKLYEFLNNSADDVIKFCSLLDIFDLKRFPLDESLLEEVDIEHHVETKIEDVSERCRKILMRSCDTDCGQLKKDINTPGHPRLSLFRGFSRFMEEDLEQHPSLISLSRKKQKKVISKVAFEMIKRNDAYSNLVELIFPMHLRFSIHAHTNAGPKFGIRLLSSDYCRVVKSLDECDSPNYDDLLHIPTPWHNTIVNIGSDSMYYITKAEVISSALSNRSHIGGWSHQEKCYKIVPAVRESSL